MTIRVSCFTNIDEYKQEAWPEKMICRPVVGDWVQSHSGKKLQIVAITHQQIFATHVLNNDVVFLNIELRK